MSEIENDVMTPPAIELEEISWKEVGSDDNPRGRLHTTIRVGTIHMHLEAIEVQTGAFGVNFAKIPEADPDLRALENL